MFFSRSKPLVGLDIGTSSIKAAVLKPRGKGKGYMLEHFAIEPLPPEVIVEGSIMDSGPIVDAIVRVCEAGNIRSTDVATSVSGHSVIVKRVSIPSMSEEELAESIHWEAEQYIPFDIEDVNIDYQVLGESEGADHMDVLLVAVKKDKINDYTNVISQAGKTPVLVDVDTFAVQNTFEMNYGAPTDQVVALVNMGAAVTNVAILSDGNAQFWRDLSVGGNQVTEAVQKELGLGFEAAEAAKLGEQVDGATPESLDAVLNSVTQDMVTEIQKTIDFYLSSHTDQQLDRIVLTGGASQLQTIPAALTDRYSCEVEHLDPFRSVAVDDRNLPPETRAEIASAAAVAIGLGIRKVGDK